MENEKIPESIPLPALPPEEAPQTKPVRVSKAFKDLVDVAKETIRIKRDLKKVGAYRKAKIEQSELLIIKKLPNIIRKLIVKAEEGDLKAAKILLDRILPVHKPVDAEDIANRKSAGFSINISINGGEPGTLSSSGIKPEDDIEDIIEGVFSDIPVE